ncbi:MAG: 8-amino-7-oxononanoate synthase [Acidobacteria bacterium]|nr:8-amino-7-oxononanoate synthase [Acidobacteriota bacterium]
MSSPLERRIADELRALEERSLRRVPRAPSGVDLSSNDYLGLADHPLVTQRMIAAVERDGCGSTGSRLLRGHRDAFASLERAFAAFVHAERAVYFSSGYLANLAVLTTFPGRGDLIVSDRANHASLRDGARLSLAKRVTFPHSDAEALARLLRARRGRGEAFVVTESLFSMDGDVPPLEQYAAICRRSGARLIVDEAHAVGIFGARGRGLVEERGIERDVFLIVSTAGKALGVAGAFVSGPAWAIEYMVQRARPFVFSTAPPPAVAAAIEASLSIVAAEPDRRRSLRAKAERLRARLADAGVPVAAGDSPIVPVILGSAARAQAVAEALQSEGFDVRAVRPPTVPAGTARLRVSVNVRLSDETIDRFVRSLAIALERTTACSTVSS